MRITKSQLKQIIKEELESVTERCQKGYKTHHKRKTKVMFGKRYRNCVKAEAKGEKEGQDLESEIRTVLKKEGGAAGLDGIVKAVSAGKDEVKATLKAMTDVGLHRNGDYILDDDAEIDVEKKLNDGPSLNTMQEKKKRKRQKGAKRARQTAKRKKKKKKKKGSKICPSGIAWAKRTFDTYPSAYANLAASKYCKDPNYAKDSKRKNESAEIEEGELQKWLDQKWKRIDSKGNIAGECGTSKDKKNPDRCLPAGKARSMTKSQRAATAKKKKTAQKTGKDSGKTSYVKNTKKGKVTNSKTRKEGKSMDRQRLLEIIQEELDEMAYYEMLAEGETLEEAEYQGRKVTLNKPMKGDVKKSKVYVKNEKGNVVKVNFGDPNMKIRKNNPKARKSFRARHKCHEKKPKTSPGYWSCKAW